jgi:hypothetical protein
MGRLEDYYQSQAGLQQNGNTQQPVGSIVLPTLDTTNPIGSLAELLGPSPAEREAQERRMMQNRSKMQAWMGLFDGLRQLGNLYYSTKGATPQTYNNPYQLVDNEIQQQRQLRDGITNYKRQYATSLYNLQRQIEADRMAKEKHDANLNWYDTREEMARLKAENDKLKTEAAARNTDARTKNTEAKTETENFLRGKRGDVYDSQVKRNLQQGQAAVTRANKSGGGKKKSGDTKKKKIITGYQIKGGNTGSSSKKGSLY